MTPEQNSPETDRQQFLGTLDRAVRDGDMSFATTLVAGQRVLDPYGLALHMNQNRRDIENYGPDGRQRWRVLLQAHLRSLEDKLESGEFAQEEVELLKLMAHTLERAEES